MTKTYSIHLPPGSAPRTVEGADSIRFVKDGFIWPALLLPAVWMLYHRMWLPVLGYLILSLALIAGLSALDIAQDAISLSGFLLNVLVALEGGTLRRWSLRRKGWRMIGVATGADRAECERKAFERWLAGDLPDGDSTDAVHRFHDGTPDERTEPDVIGMFPDPEPGR